MSLQDRFSIPFRKEIDAVIHKGLMTPASHYIVEVIIKNETYRPYSIVGLIKVDDFILNYYPIIALDLLVAPSWKEKMLANNNDLEVVLKEYDIPRLAQFDPKNLKNPRIKRWKARLYTEESDFIKQASPEVNNKTLRDTHTFVKVRLQLFEKGFEQLKTRHVGGIYHNVTGGDLIKHLVSYHANLDNDDVSSMINGVDIVKEHNTNPKEQIVLEHGTTLIEAMRLVNHSCGGLYSTGFSFYIHNNTWYVFPPYAINRYSEQRTKLLIINLPKNKIPGIEKTYHVSDELITILSTRDTDIKDKRESLKMNFGTGFRFADAAKIVQEWGEVIDNKLKVNAARNINDIVVSDREQKEQHQIKFTDVKVTSAKNIELSKLAETKIMMIRISWEGGDPSLIYPGMPIKVMYLEEGKPKTVVGSVVGVETSYFPMEKDFPPKKFDKLTYIQAAVSDEVNNER